MYQNFLNLKRDIAGFIVRLDNYIKDKGVELAEEAKVLTTAIEGLQTEVDA